MNAPRDLSEKEPFLIELVRRRTGLAVMWCGGGWHDHWRLPSSNMQHSLFFFFFYGRPQNVLIYTRMMEGNNPTKKRREGSRKKVMMRYGDERLFFFFFLPSFVVDVIYDVSPSIQETIWGKLFTTLRFFFYRRQERRGKRIVSLSLCAIQFGRDSARQSYWIWANRWATGSVCQRNKRRGSVGCLIDENVLCIGLLKR